MRWVIVAHPDDEVIFAGGAILSHPGEPWMVVVATHAEGSPRAAESLAARDQLRRQGVEIDYRFLGHPDDPQLPGAGIEGVRLRRELAGLGVGPTERVYTHGSPGEYGHNGHKAVHAGVVDVLSAAGAVSVFSGAGEVVERIVDARVLAGKALLFNHAYLSQRGVWERLSPVMIQAISEERHLALSVLDGALADTTNPLRRFAAPSAGGPEPGALAIEVNAQIAAVRNDMADALIVGAGEGVDFPLLRSRLSGRIDFVGPFASPPEGRVLADEFSAWEPDAAAYDLLLVLDLPARAPDLDAVFRKIAEALRPKGQAILAHEPLIQGHHDYGRPGIVADEPYYRRPTQAILDLARRHGMKLRFIKELVTGRRQGEPVVSQLVRLERR